MEKITIENKTNLIDKKIKELKEKHKNILLLTFPKDENKFYVDIQKSFESNPDEFLYCVCRRPTRFEYSIILNHLNNNLHITALEAFFNMCWLDGDSILRSNDDYFIPIAQEPETFKQINSILTVNDWYLDKEKFEIYISKDVAQFDNIIGEEKNIKLKKDIELNKDNYRKFKFRKASRYELEKNYGAEIVQASAHFLYTLCEEGEKELILKDDDIFFCLANSELSNMIANKKIISIKKN